MTEGVYLCIEATYMLEIKMDQQYQEFIEMKESGAVKTYDSALVHLI